jgi:chemotaxis protein MotA
MDSLNSNKYIVASKRRFDPFSILLGIAGIASAFIAVMSLKDVKSYLELRSFFAVFVGTLGILLFQFDTKTFFRTMILSLKTFTGMNDREIVLTMNEIDQAVLNKKYLSELREVKTLNGEYINDSLYMIQQGLLYEEIESFFNSRFSDEYFKRENCVDFLRKGASIAPALGLFGTVMGLIGVLKSLSDPTQIGPSMSLALMTTAYGAALGSLFFTPLLGRLEQYNISFLETREQLLNKLKILISREERRFDRELLIEKEEEEDETN